MKNKKTIGSILLFIFGCATAIDYCYSLEYMLSLTIFLFTILFFLVRKLWIIARHADYENYLSFNYPQDYIDHLHNSKEREEQDRIKEEEQRREEKKRKREEKKR